MAGSSLVLTDGSRLSWYDQRLYRLERLLALVGGLTVFSLMILAVLSVSGRNFANHPLPGYVDWIEQAMPLIAFLGVSYVQRDGGHIRMDMLVGALKGWSLYAVEFFTTLVFLGLMLLLLWGSWAHFDRSFDFGQPLWSRDSSMDISLPLWPAKLMAPVAFAVLCLRLCLQLWAYGRALRMGVGHAIAVPQIADAATLAAMEAEHVSANDVKDTAHGTD